VLAAQGTTAWELLMNIETRRRFLRRAADGSGDQAAALKAALADGSGDVRGFVELNAQQLLQREREAGVLGRARAARDWLVVELVLRFQLVERFYQHDQQQQQQQLQQNLQDLQQIEPALLQSLGRDAMAPTGTIYGMPYHKNAMQLLLSLAQQEQSDAWARTRSRARKADRRQPDNPRCVTLTNPATNATVHVVGVCHVSVRSQDDVRQVIKDAQPDIVCVESCMARGQVMRMDKREHEQTRQVLPDLSSIARDHWGKLCLAGVAVPLFPLVCGAAAVLVSACNPQHAQLADVSEGGEMLVAMGEATALGAKCYAIDRNIGVTVARCLGELTSGGLCSALRAGLESAFEDDAGFDKMEAKVRPLLETDRQWTESDVRECQALARTWLDEIVIKPEDAVDGTVPCIDRALVWERDQYLAHHLWQATQTPGSTTVAVVGAAHVPGIQAHFGKTTDARIEEFSQWPSGLSSGLSGLGRGGVQFGTAAVLGPPAAAYFAYRTLGRRYSPRVARAGVLGVGAVMIAGAAYAAVDAYNTTRRIQIETRGSRVLSTFSGEGLKELEEQRMLPAVGQLATTMTTGLPPGTDRVRSSTT